MTMSSSLKFVQENKYKSGAAASTLLVFLYGLYQIYNGDRVQALKVLYAVYTVVFFTYLGMSLSNFFQARSQQRGQSTESSVEQPALQNN